MAETVTQNDRLNQLKIEYTPVYLMITNDNAVRQ